MRVAFAGIVAAGFVCRDLIIVGQDDGAGKTQLMAKFATGAAQQIAIEP